MMDVPVMLRLFTATSAVVFLLFDLQGPKEDRSRVQRLIEGPPFCGGKGSPLHWGISFVLSMQGICVNQDSSGLASKGFGLQGASSKGFTTSLLVI